MSFITYTKALLVRWWIFLIATILGVVISFFVSRYVLTPSYEVYATIYVKQVQGEYFIKDYNQLYYSGQVYEDVLKKLDNVISKDELVMGMDIYQVNNTGFINLIFNYKNPEIAMNVVNQLADSMILKAKTLHINNKIKIIEYAKRPVHQVSPGIIKNVTQTVILLWILIILIFHFKVFRKVNKYEYVSMLEGEFCNLILSSVAIAREGSGKDISKDKI